MNPEPTFPDHARHIARDMVLLALDALDPQPITERQHIEARTALAEALDALEGEA